MPASGVLAATSTPRSSPRSQRLKAGTHIPADSPLSKEKSGEARTPAKANGLAVKGSEVTESPKSRKRVKTEVAIIKEESPALVKGQIPKANKKKTTVKQEEEVETEGNQAKRTKRKREAEDEEETQINGSSPKKSRRKQASNAEEEVEDIETLSQRVKHKKLTKVEEEEASANEPSPQKTKRKNKVKEEEEVQEDEGGEKKVKKKRKTKEEKEAEAMPLAARTNGLRMFIGAHVSCAKGVQNSVTNCVHIGGNAFAMFLKSQRKWENPPLQDEHRDQFISFCGDHKYDAASHVLPHGSYLVNLAQEEPEKATQAYNAFLDDLHRCEALGIKLYNFHPGSTGSHPRPSAISRIASALNRANLATKTVTPVLETMAGGGNVVGSTFEDLRDIIAQIDDKKRIGVCLDTCHVFAAGYDLRTPTAFKETLNQFDKIVGMEYLKALHLNDSKAPFSSHRDLHQNIGLGFLGLRAFHNVMNEPRLEGLPMVLETPIDHKDEETGKEVEDKGVWAREIKMLEGLMGMDVEGEEFKNMEKELADQGAEERKKLQEQFEKKVEKDRKKEEKGQTKLQFGKKKKADEGGSDSEGR